MKNIASKLSNLAIALLFIAGLGILFYPSFSDAYNKWLFSRVVISYKEEMATYRPEEAEIILHQARAYNLQLHRGLVASETYTPIDYYSSLNLYNGMMGYIEISKIGVSLPIYHGTSDAVLQKGVGHLDWTSLPTGELGNHTVLTGHTGLPSAKLFTDVEQLGIGDSFVVRVLSEDFYYKIFDIQVVLPTEVDSLERIVGRDLVTLVTCTPYGINSHRLLVTGERFYPTEAEIPDLLLEESVESPAMYLGIFVLVLGVLVGIVLLFMKWKQKKEEKEKKLPVNTPIFPMDDMDDWENREEELLTGGTRFDGKGERKLSSVASVEVSGKREELVTESLRETGSSRVRTRTVDRAEVEKPKSVPKSEPMAKSSKVSRGEEVRAESVVRPPRERRTSVGTSVSPEKPVEKSVNESKKSASESRPVRERRSTSREEVAKTVSKSEENVASPSSEERRERREQRGRDRRTTAPVSQGEEKPVSSNLSTEERRERRRSERRTGESVSSVGSKDVPKREKVAKVEVAKETKVEKTEHEPRARRERRTRTEPREVSSEVVPKREETTERPVRERRRRTETSTVEEGKSERVTSREREEKVENPRPRRERRDKK